MRHFVSVAAEHPPYNYDKTPVAWHHNMSFLPDRQCNGKAGCEAVRLINTLDAADGLLHIHTGSGALQGDVYMHLQYSWLCIIHGWVSGWSTRVS